MADSLVVPGVHRISFGIVNAYLVDHDGLTLIDTGLPGSKDKVVNAVRAIGRRPEEIRQIVVTHCHADHSGSLAALKRITGAPTAMHAVDAAMFREGRAVRAMQPASLMGRLMVRMAPRMGGNLEPAEIEHEIGDGEELNVGGGLRAIHVPGHCAGQIALLLPAHGGVLFIADAASNLFGLGLSPIYEDIAEGKRSLQKLASLSFEVACFGHGGPITRGASARFRRKWAPAAPAHW